MSDGVVALLAGLGTAAATVIVALINARGAKRDARGNLARDIEIARSLRDGTRGKVMYEDFISYQIMKLSVAEQTQMSRKAVFTFFILAQTIGITVAVRRYFAQPEVIDSEFTSAFWIAAIFLGVFMITDVIFVAVTSNRTANILRVRAPKAKAKRRIARLPDAARAAWVALKTNSDDTP